MNQEARNYVVAALRRNKPREDIILHLCEQHGFYWEGAKEFVAEISEELPDPAKRFASIQISTLLVLGIGIVTLFLVGMLLLWRVLFNDASFTNEWLVLRSTFLCAVTGALMFSVFVSEGITTVRRMNRMVVLGSVFVFIASVVGLTFLILNGFNIRFYDDLFATFFFMGVAFIVMLIVVVIGWNLKKLWPDNW